MTTNLSFTPIQTLLQQLWLSIAKTDFYYNVYKFYHGYGVKYFLYLTSICAIITCIFVSDNIFTFKNYFSTGRSTSRTAVTDHIIKQLPELEYDGDHLIENAQTTVPVYINDPRGRKLAVFDINNILSSNEKSKIPIIFGAKKMIINVTNNNQKNHDNITLDYPQIFGNEAKIIDREWVKSSINNYFNQSSWIFTSFLVIMLSIFYAVFYSIITLFKQFFLVSLIYIIINLIHQKFDIEQTIKKFSNELSVISRLVFFSSGSIALTQMLVIYLAPGLMFLTNFLHLWIGYLIYNGIDKNIKSMKI